MTASTRHLLVINRPPGAKAVLSIDNQPQRIVRIRVTDDRVEVLYESPIVLAVMRPADLAEPAAPAADDPPPVGDYRLAELDAQHDAWEKWAAEHDTEELPAGWYRDDMEDAHKAGWETGRAYRGPVDTGTTAPPCGFCGEPRHWTAEDDRRVAAIEQEDRAAPWRLLPPGYVIPGFTPPVRPICGHATLTPDGYAADCDAPAAYARPFTEHSEEYACAKHTDTAEVGR